MAGMRRSVAARFQTGERPLLCRQHIPSGVTLGYRRNRWWIAHTRAAAAAAAAGGRGRWGGGGDGDGDGDAKDQLFDAYEVLGIDDDADAAEIKRAYLALQKKFHPDVYAGDDVETRSAEINRAYVCLTTKSERVALDDALMRANGGVRRRGGVKGRSSLSSSGLVGPLREKLLVSLLVCGGGERACCELDTVVEMTESIREWGKMLAFTSEMPLPLPLQCDDIDGGLRLAMINFIDGRIKEVGALNITVEVVLASRTAEKSSCTTSSSVAISSTRHETDDDDDNDDGPNTRVEVRVTRSWSAADARKNAGIEEGVEQLQLPGESRILANFAEEFAFLVDKDGLKGGGQTIDEENALMAGLKNFASNISSFALPVLPLFGSPREVMPGGSYDAYRINKRSGGGWSSDESDETKDT